MSRDWIIIVYSFHDLPIETVYSKRGCINRQYMWSQSRKEQLRLSFSPHVGCDDSFVAEWMRLSCFPVQCGRRSLPKRQENITRTLFFPVKCVLKVVRLHVDVVLLRLYVVFFKGDFISHRLFLYLFISPRYFEARSCFPRVQYVLNLAQMILWIQYVCCFFFIWMVSVGAGSCWILFLDLCDVP